MRVLSLLAQPKGATQSREKGFALLTVLLVVAIVTILGSNILYKEHLTLKRSTYMLHQAQSLSVLYGLESWVKKGLRLDAEYNKFDSLDQQWALPLVAIPFEGGQISGQLEDLFAKINVNNLLETDADKQKIWRTMLERYTIQLEMEPSFMDALIDWVDSDDERLPFGAESETYLLMEPAYRTANQGIVSLNELKNVKGLNTLPTKQWDLFKQDLTALPMVTSININTASEAVLLALTDWMSTEVVNSWIQSRKAGPAKNIEEFRVFLIEQTGFSAEEITRDLPDWMVGVQSQFFLLNGRIHYGDSNQGVSAIFYRGSDAKVSLLQRWLSASE
ncbi:MAG: type II secretion system minor pseudopilin GspK [Pseudomonadota bacterium]